MQFDANIHMNQPTKSSGSTVREAEAVVLMIHGRGRNPTDMLQFASKLDVGDVAFVAPAAAGGSWCPGGFMQPLEMNEPYLTYSLVAIKSQLEKIKLQGKDCSQVVLFGFSQGACLVCEYAMRHPQRYGGIVASIGGLYGPPGISWPEQGGFDATPIYLSGREIDDWVPRARVLETADFFAAQGADVTVNIAVGAEHSVSDVDLESARTIISRVTKVS